MARSIPIRATVRRRAAGHCEICNELFMGYPNQLTSQSMHHRLPRRNGGVDSIPNLILVCIKCHRIIHNDEDFAARSGFIVYDEPELTPVLIHGISWSALNLDGSYESLSRDDAVAMISYLMLNSSAIVLA